MSYSTVGRWAARSARRFSGSRAKTRLTSVALARSTLARANSSKRLPRPITVVDAGTFGTARSCSPARSFLWWSRSERKSPPTSIVSANATITPPSMSPRLRFLNEGPPVSMVAVIPSNLSSFATRCRPARGVIRPSGAPSTTLRFFFAILVTRQVPFTLGHGVFVNHHFPRCRALCRVSNARSRGLTHGCRSEVTVRQFRSIPA
jgi:hypothetical protein